ncbi:nucleotidyltransferase domain-containing protein [Staphylothermus marinus]|uniref:nucleotidyltransferase domain-containing protein n=1 Tax=Staphylothermus marinus TaxID=2280 RepID=UPI00146E3981
MIAGALSRRDEVLLAVIYGGFIEYESFRDIDVAVFTGYKIPYSRVQEYEDQLSEELEELVKIPVDVRVLDYTPSWFRVRALEGIVVVEKIPALATRLKFKSYQELSDIRAKIEYLKTRL